jgi:hypothetical protein
MNEAMIHKASTARVIRFEEGEKAIIGVVSDLRKDRDNEVVLPEGLDDSTESGVVSWNHDYCRDDIPHARTLWNQLDPKRDPYQVISKTLYLTDLSELGNKIYEYRKAGHPLGQSIGFKGVESVSRGQSGYEDVYKAWLPRVKAMLKEKGIKPAADEFNEPYRFFTKWQKWEHGDVFIGSNPDALQIAVSKGLLSNEQARGLVDFQKSAESPEENEITKLMDRIAAMQEEIDELKKEKGIEPPSLSLAEMWDAKSIQEMWEATE